VGFDCIDGGLKSCKITLGPVFNNAAACGTQKPLHRQSGGIALKIGV
jgi:hypothetical protein